MPSEPKTPKEWAQEIHDSCIGADDPIPLIVDTIHQIRQQAFEEAAKACLDLMDKLEYSDDTWREVEFPIPHRKREVKRARSPRRSKP